MAFFNIPGHGELGQFNAMQNWIQRVQNVAAANKANAAQLMAKTIKVPVNEARDVQRITDLGIRPTPADVNSDVGTARIAATAKAAQVDASLQKAVGDTLEKQIRDLLTQEENATDGAQKMQLRQQISDMVCQLVTARVGASRSAVTAGALRAGVKFQKKAKSITSDAASQAKLLTQAAQAVQVAQQAATAPVNVQLPDVVYQNTGVVPPGYVQARLTDPSKPVLALSGLNGVFDALFAAQVKSVVKAAQAPVTMGALVTSATQAAQGAAASAMKGTPQPVGMPGLIGALVSAANKAKNTGVAPPVVSTIHGAVTASTPIGAIGQAMANAALGVAAAAMKQQSGVRPPPTNITAAPVSKSSPPPIFGTSVFRGAARGGLGDVNPALVMAAVLDADNAGTSTSSSVETVSADAAPAADTALDPAVEAEVNNQIVNATPPGMVAPTSAAGWIFPSLVVGGSLLLMLVL